MRSCVDDAEVRAVFLSGVDDFCKTASVRGDDDRGGYDSRTLIMRVEKLELRVPQDRQRRFSTHLFDRYQRSEKALFSALAQMYV